MYATVYRTRSKGVRLPTPSRPVAGRLRLDKRSDGDRVSLAAKLTVENGEGLLLPELLNARVLRITTNGIVIAGQEIVPRRTTNKSSADYWLQTWWCLVHTVALAEALDVLNEQDHPFGTVSAACVSKQPLRRN